MSDAKTKSASVRRRESENDAAYDRDVILWSQEQARLLRAGRFAELDIEHLADEIEDVGKSEKRELVSRMAVLLAHLIKWSRQPESRTKGWRATISHQRNTVSTLAIKETLTFDRSSYAGPGLAGKRKCGSTRFAQAGKDDADWRRLPLPESCP